LTPTKQFDSLLVSTLDSTIRLMDRANGKLLQSFKASDYVNTSYRIRSTLGLNDSVVVSGSENGTIFVWDLLEGSVKHRLRHNSEEGSKNAKKDVVSAVAFCWARKEWVSAGGDGKSACPLCVWCQTGGLQGGSACGSMLIYASQAMWSSGACRNEHRDEGYSWACQQACHILEKTLTRKPHLLS